MPSTRTVMDAVGRPHQPAESDARIVSLVPSLTELLFDLGLDRQIVGRTAWCLSPSEKVTAIRPVGGTKKVNMPRLRKLQPTHLIVNIDENPREMVEEIATFVPNVIVTHPIRPSDNCHIYRLLGAVFGVEARAQALCRAYEVAARSLAIGTCVYQPRKVLYLIWKDPWMTVSKDTYIAQMLALVNWHVVVHDPNVRYPTLDLRAGLPVDTDLVLFSSEPYSFDTADVERFRHDYANADTTLRAIDGAMVSWYGSRVIRGLRYLGDFAANLNQSQP